MAKKGIYPTFSYPLKRRNLSLSNCDYSEFRIHDGELKVTI